MKKIVIIVLLISLCRCWGGKPLAKPSGTYQSTGSVIKTLTFEGDSVKWCDVNGSCRYSKYTLVGNKIVFYNYPTDAIESLGDSLWGNLGSTQITVRCQDMMFLIAGSKTNLCSVDSISFGRQ